MSMTYPYKITLIPSGYKQFGGKKFHLLNAQFINQGKILFFENFLSQILFLNIQHYFESFQELQLDLDHQYIQQLLQNLTYFS